MIDDLRDHLIDEYGFELTDPVFKKMMADIQLIADGYRKERELESLDRLQQTVIEEYCLDEAQHEIVMNVFEAERNKLKEGSSDEDS